MVSVEDATPAYPPMLQALGFPEHDSATLTRLVNTTRQLSRTPDRDLRSLVAQILSRLWDVAPDYAVQLASKETAAAPEPADDWWVPEDIPAPPTTERVTGEAPLITREDVDLVLKDL